MKTPAALLVVDTLSTAALVAAVATGKQSWQSAAASFAAVGVGQLVGGHLWKKHPGWGAFLGGVAASFALTAAGRVLRPAPAVSA